MEPNQGFKDWPIGTKAAKEVHRKGKQHEGALYTHAEAMKVLAAATMRMAALFEDQNLLLPMTTPELQVTTTEAQEFLHLRQLEELQKLLKQLAKAKEQEISLWVEKEQRDKEALAKSVAKARKNEEMLRQMRASRDQFHEENKENQSKQGEDDGDQFGQGEDDSGLGT
jgi:hypothetical protein